MSQSLPDHPFDFTRLYERFRGRARPGALENDTRRAPDDERGVLRGQDIIKIIVVVVVIDGIRLVVVLYFSGPTSSWGYIGSYLSGVITGYSYAERIGRLKDFAMNFGVGLVKRYLGF